ncbi:MAG: hypothetical protein WBA73_18615 [Devosia sp.]
MNRLISLPSLLRKPLVIVALATLSACSTGQFVGMTPGTVTAPAAERIGDGTAIVGVIPVTEAASLSGGAPDSVYLAAKLAANALPAGTASVEIRQAGPSESAIRGAANNLANSGAKIVIVADPNQEAGAAAAALAPKGITTISLSGIADTGRQLYGAGLMPREEAIALASELTRRGEKAVVIAATGDPASQTFATAVAAVAGAQQIASVMVDASSPQSLIAALQGLQQQGAPYSSIIFAVGPQHGTMLVEQLQVAGLLADARMVGNAGWAMAEPLPAALKGAWYPSLPRARLDAFVQKFRAAYGSNPTLMGAVAYDLVILAAALPKAYPDAPYAPAVLTSSQGFSGFSGPFRFGSAYMVEPRRYEISTVR